MRLILVYLCTLFAGAVIAAVIAKIVGHWFPRATIPVFLALVVYWTYLGWCYARSRDR